MKRKQYLKGSVVLSLFCIAVLVAIMLFGQKSVTAQPKVSSLVAPTLLGQQWSAKQKEVWSTVEKLWECFAKEDLQGALSINHPDFRGWLSNDPLPRNKASEMKWASYFLKYQQTLEQELKPVAIDIHDNFAFVHYYYTVAFKDAEGKHKMEKGRWTDVYMKDGDNWLLICDHGGPTSVE